MSKRPWMTGEWRPDVLTDLFPLLILLFALKMRYTRS